MTTIRKFSPAVKPIQVPCDFGRFPSVLDLCVTFGDDFALAALVRLWSYAVEYGDERREYSDPEMIWFACTRKDRRGAKKAKSLFNMLVGYRFLVVTERGARIMGPFEALQVEVKGHWGGNGKDRFLNATDRRNILAGVTEVPVCAYCLRPTTERGGTHIDHIIPLSRGGQTAPENLVVSCRECNLLKGARTPEEAGMRIGGVRP